MMRHGTAVMSQDLLHRDAGAGGKMVDLVGNTAKKQPLDVA
jgi:hypothetical protein